MTGSVVEMRAAEGATVAAGDTLLVITAMKMESEVQAPCAGVVAQGAGLAARRRRLRPASVGGHHARRR